MNINRIPNANNMNRNAFLTASDNNNSAPAMGLPSGLGQHPNQQRLLIGGGGAGGAGGGFDLSDRIAAFASGVDLSQSGNTLPSMGKFVGHPTSTDMLKNSLYGNGKCNNYSKPVIDLNGFHQRPIHVPNAAAAAVATAFPPPVDIGLKTAHFARDQTTANHGEDWKKKQRLEQNKLAARRSRKRKKIILEELQCTVDQLKAEYKQLERQNKALEAELKRRKLAAVKSTECSHEKKTDTREASVLVTDEAIEKKDTGATSAGSAVATSNQASFPLTVADRATTTTTTTTTLLTQLATVVDNAVPARATGTAVDPATALLQQEILAIYQKQQQSGDNK